MSPASINGGYQWRTIGLIRIHAYEGKTYFLSNTVYVNYLSGDGCCV